MIIFFCFLFLFLLIVLIKDQCCFYIVFQLGFIIVFMQVSSPALFLFPFFMFFPPQTFYVKQKSSYFCIFISCGKADCRLSVSPLKGFAPSSWVLFLVAPSGDEQLGSHGCTRTIIPVFNDKKKCKGKRMEELFSWFFLFFSLPLCPSVRLILFLFFNFFVVFVWKRNLQTAARPKTTSIGCLPLGNWMFSLLWRVWHKGSIT